MIPSSLDAWLRRPPLGVLVIGGLLLFLGAGLFVGGAYIVIHRRDQSGWMVWLTALVIGPLMIYVALHVISLSSWSWLVMAALLVLLLVSSLTRAVIAPSFPAAAFAEMAAEVLAISYLFRRPVRRAFNRG